MACWPSLETKVRANNQCVHVHEVRAKCGVVPDHLATTRGGVQTVRTRTWRPSPPGSPSQRRRPSPTTPPAPHPPAPADSRTALSSAAGWQSGICFTILTHSAKCWQIRLCIASLRAHTTAQDADVLAWSISSVQRGLCEVRGAPRHPLASGQRAAPQPPDWPSRRRYPSSPLPLLAATPRRLLRRAHSQRPPA